MRNSRFLFWEHNSSFSHFGHVCKFPLHFNLPWFAQIQTETLAVVSIQVKSESTPDRLHRHTVRRWSKASIISHPSKYPEEGLLPSPMNVMKFPGQAQSLSGPPHIPSMSFQYSKIIRHYTKEVYRP